MDRKYSLAEIDAMRLAISKRLGEPPVGHGINTVNESQKLWVDHWSRVENQLRTYMLNGTDPEELVGGLTE